MYHSQLGKYSFEVLHLNRKRKLAQHLSCATSCFNAEKAIHLSHSLVTLEGLPEGVANFQEVAGDHLELQVILGNQYQFIQRKWLLWKVGYYGIIPH